MKKIIARTVSLFLVSCMLVLCLTGCKTKLSGTYTNDKGLIEQSFTFEGDKVKMSAFGIEIEGKYVIEDDQITITYSLMDISYNWKKDFEKHGDTIIIDGTAFEKS